jgi:hypothetical protein
MLVMSVFHEHGLNPQFPTRILNLLAHCGIAEIRGVGPCLGVIEYHETPGLVGGHVAFQSGLLYTYKMWRVADGC